MMLHDRWEVVWHEDEGLVFMWVPAGTNVVPYGPVWWVVPSEAELPPEYTDPDVLVREKPIERKMGEVRWYV